ncbi:MAG: hypothetical protein ACKVQS_02740 [Fimbriimonadaceae bacterium]
MMKTARKRLTPEERTSSPFLQKREKDRKNWSCWRRLKAVGEQIAKYVPEEDILTNNHDAIWIDKKTP